MCARLRLVSQKAKICLIHNAIQIKKSRVKREIERKECALRLSIVTGHQQDASITVRKEEEYGKMCTSDDPEYRHLLQIIENADLVMVSSLTRYR